MLTLADVEEIAIAPSLVACDVKVDMRDDISYCPGLQDVMVGEISKSAFSMSACCIFWSE